MGPETAPVPILIVDDDEFMRAYLREALEGAGHRVVAAANAPEALRLARETSPRLVLLDLFMPERSGLDVLPDLQALLPNVPIIVVSSMDEEALISQALALGASDFVTKPFHPLELADAIRRGLEGDVP